MIQRRGAVLLGGEQGVERGLLGIGAAEVDADAVENGGLWQQAGVILCTGMRRARVCQNSTRGAFNGPGDAGHGALRGGGGGGQQGAESEREGFRECSQIGCNELHGEKTDFPEMGQAPGRTQP